MLPLEDRELLTQTMLGLNMDPATVASLMASFDRAATRLEAKPIAPVPHSAFGDSDTGGRRLATNAEMAHAAVDDELKKMATGLRGMGTALDDFLEDVKQTTEQTTATMSQINLSVECVAAPQFDSGSCSLPIENEG